MPVKVLIADDQTALLPRYRESWERALGSAVRYETTHDLSSVEQRLKDRPHIVIVDNQFSTSTNEGATFIAKNKSRHPDTVFILMTGASFDVEQLGQRCPNPDFIVPKSYLLVDSYLEYIGKAITEKLRRSPIEVSAPTVGLREIGISRDAFCSLVEQCVCALEVLSFSVSPEPTAEFELLSGGYSGAAVYQMRLRGAGRSPSLPLVIKCGTREQIEREIRSFEGWVRWQLPHDMRVDIIGRGLTGDHAAICYGFVLGSAERLETLKKAIQRADWPVVDRAVRRVLFADRSGWYSPIRPGPIGLCAYLLNRPEYAPSKDDKRNRRYRESMESIAEAERISHSITGGEIIFDGQQLGSIRRTIAAVNDGPVKLVYCHGDLNANNIFLDEAHGGLALIDFEQSGENHIFRDIISVETSVRMELPTAQTTDLSFADLIELEIRVNKDKSTSVGTTYASWLGQVRSIAKSRFPDTTDHEYVVPLILHSWKVIGIQKWDYEVQRRLCAALIGGLKTLRNLS